MKTFTLDELKAVLAHHALWLSSGYAEGTRANLRDADLTRANLTGANLTGADLSGADLSYAYLSGANLSGAYLSGANLPRANLRDADLNGANLPRADLSGANLPRANLTRANLTRADLSGADLSGADLSYAYLSGANLSGADLARAYLSGAYLPHYAHCPQEGEFIAFKKLTGGVVAKLKIPADAARTSSLVGRKCRAEYVEVLELSGGVVEAVSSHDHRTVYAVGETVRPDNYDPDIRVECTNGIHFFISRREAEEY